MIFPVSSIRDPVHLRISIPQTGYHRLREIKLSCILYVVCVLFIFRICTGYVQISQINLCTMTHYFANIVHHAFIVCIFSSVYMYMYIPVPMLYIPYSHSVFLPNVSAN